MSALHSPISRLLAEAAHHLVHISRSAHGLSVLCSHTLGARHLLAPHSHLPSPCLHPLIADAQQQTLLVHLDRVDQLLDYWHLGKILNRDAGSVQMLIHI